MSHTYTIKTESKEDPKASVITKTNVEVDFTLNELEANEREFAKMVKQLTAQKQLADAKMTNIERNHPFVMDLSEEQAFTVHMYQEARAMSRVCGQKLPEYETELKYIADEKAEIAKQIGIAIPASALAEGTAPDAPVAPTEPTPPSTPNA